MEHTRRLRAGAGVCASLLPLIGLLLVAGCSKSADTSGTAPPGPAPGRAMAGRPGGPGQVVAANATGAQIYALKCQGCHGAQGQGVRGPALTRLGNKSVADVSRIIHDGHGRMPAFGSQLTGAQITTVATYARSFAGK